MENKQGPRGAVGKGGVNSAPQNYNLTVRVAAEQLVMMPISDLVPYANNARVHRKAQIAQLKHCLPGICGLMPKWKSCGAGHPWS